MRRMVVTRTNTGSSDLCVMNLNTSPFNVGIGCDITSGSPTYTVQHTFDDVFAPTFDPATATWYNHPTLNAAIADADGNYAFPVTAIKVVVTGTGVVRMTVIQAGIQ